MRKAIVASVLCLSVLALASCPLDLRGYVEWLKVRDLLIPIEEILIASAGDSFQMGDGFIGPNPTRRQNLTYSFRMSKYEITNAQFKVFVDQGGYTTQSYWTNAGWAWLVGMWPAPAGRMPARWTDPVFNAPDQPVVGVSWYEAVAFCNWRSEKEGLTVAYDLSNGKIIASANGYRLPTLVEREYAAAKGEPGAAERIWPYGDSIPDSSKAVYLAASTLAVGSKSPAGDTPQGLADMSGNAVEWCSDNVWVLILDNTTDWYYLDDTGGATSMIMRGGAWSTTSTDELRNANDMSMAAALPGDRASWFGFRTVRRQ
jgi:formylglycine-generating enzyme required for sulfatase activity